MNVMVSWVLVVLLIASGISLVIFTASPALERAESALELQLAENALERLLDAIEDVASEGEGSSRLVEMPEGWVVNNNTIAYSIATDSMETGTRDIGRIEKISGSDVSCSGDDDFVLENSLLKVRLKKQNGDVTSDNIIEIRNKAADVTITPADSSIIIDDIPGTKRGTGHSRIETDSRAKCAVRYHIDSNAGISYDIFYTLYAGADFIVVEVENVEG